MTTQQPPPRYRCVISTPFSEDQEKLTPKIYSLVRKCHEHIQNEWKKKGKKRGVMKGIKDITKSLRICVEKKKKPQHLEGAVLVLGADTSPYDVVSHLPVLAEQADVTYVWVPSRKELGIAAGSRRPTSVVLVQSFEPYASSLSKVERVVKKLLAGDEEEQQ